LGTITGPPSGRAAAILRSAVLWASSVLWDAIANGGKGARGILVVVIILCRILQLVEVQRVLFPSFVVTVVSSTIGILMRLIHFVPIVRQLWQFKRD
jgi:hypothetical protein